MRFVAGMEGGESTKLVWRGDMSTVVGMGSTEKIKPRGLVVGGRYLHRNGLFIRQVEAIEGNTVHYHGSNGGEGVEEVAVDDKSARALKECLDFLGHLWGESRFKDLAKPQPGGDFGKEVRQVGTEPVVLRDLLETEVDGVVRRHRWPTMFSVGAAGRNAKRACADFG